jgi:hypothetical protein
MKSYIRIPRLRLREDTETSYQTENCLPAALKHKVTPYHSKLHHLYGLPKIHNRDFPLRPTVSSIDPLCYALAEFLHKASHLAGNRDFFMKNSEYFTKLTQDTNLQNGDYIASFDAVSTFTSIPVEEVLLVIRNRLSTDPSFL